MTLPVTPLNTLAPYLIAEDLGLIYATGSKIDRLLDDLRDEATKLGADAIVRVRFSFEGRGMAYGCAVRLAKPTP
ncbi:MAG: hypothetical protein H6737_31980 [Alphaproteobacteria bacterium]|nr:hypothetical protein [Alphaproteobacteria bacterium]